MSGVSSNELRACHCHEVVGKDEHGDSLYCGKPVSILRPPRCVEHVAATVQSAEQREELDRRRLRRVEGISRLHTAKQLIVPGHQARMPMR